VAYTVRLGYVISLLVSAALIMFPLRSSLLELLGCLPPPEARAASPEEVVSNDGGVNFANPTDDASSSPYPQTTAASQNLACQTKRYHKIFSIVTVLLLVGIYATVVLFSNIWTVISLVGSVSCTVMCFILPGAVLLVTYDKEGGKDLKERRKGGKGCTILVKGLAWLVGLLGVALLINGVASVFLLSSN